jgi:SAM-dependent methyltransferase
MTDWSTFNYGSPLSEWIPKIRELLIDGSVLDIGSGNGRFLGAFEGRDYTGIDINKIAIDWAKKTYPQHTWICEDFNLWEPKKTYDNIFSWVSLQHIENIDWKRLKKMGRNFVFCECVKPIESTYQWTHDYEKHFKIISKEMILPDTTALMKLK